MENYSRKSFLDLYTSYSLTNLVSPLEFLTRLIGLSTDSFLRGSKLSYFLRLALLTDLWVEFIYTLLVLSLVPTGNRETLFRFPDIGYLILDERRHLLSVIIICYRLNGALNATLFHLDNHQWFREANSLFQELVEPQTAAKLERVSQRCRRSIAFIFVNFSFSITIQQIMGGFFLYPDRTAQDSMWNSHLQLAVYTVLNTSLNSYGYIKLYFFCKLSTAMFEQINESFHRDVIVNRRHRLFQYHFDRYCKQCLLNHYLSVHIRQAYLVLMVVNLPFVASFFYNAFYSDLSLKFRLIYSNFMICVMILVLFYSKVVGEVDEKAKIIGEPIYYRYVIEQRCQLARKIVLKFSKFYFYIQNSTIGVTVLGKPINMNTSITILTLFLTLITFVLTNVKKNSQIRE